MIAWKAHAKPIYSIAFTPDSSAVVPRRATKR